MSSHVLKPIGFVARIVARAGRAMMWVAVAFASVFADKPASPNQTEPLRTEVDDRKRSS